MYVEVFWSILPYKITTSSSEQVMRINKETINTGIQ